MRLESGVAELEDRIDWNELKALLKPYRELPVVGLHLEPRTREGLVKSGAGFLRTVYGRCTDCDGLLKLWARPEEVNLLQKADANKDQ